MGKNEEIHCPFISVTFLVRFHSTYIHSFNVKYHFPYDFLKKLPISDNRLELSENTYVVIVLPNSEPIIVNIGLGTEFHPEASKIEIRCKV